MTSKILDQRMTSKYSKRNTGFFLVLLVFLFLLSPSIRAQSPEEMMMLAMFYEEKDLVITPTRYPKPICQVAENISIIYSDEIEAMNAHTVAEVLRWMPGIFVSSSLDSGATSLLTIQGSNARHVTVLLDGIRWNSLSGGNAEALTIPVGIIDRIEVVKGPASSAWGSSLGGIVNIITKAAAGKTVESDVYVSYGEASSLDGRAETSGGGENFSYYLYAGRQESDGLRDGRKMENLSLFSKFNLTLSQKTGLGVIFGFSEPENDLGTFPSNDIQSNSENRSVYANASLDIELTSRSMFNFSGYFLNQDFILNNEFMGLGPYAAAGDLYLNSDYGENLYGAAAKYVWEPEGHTVVMGTDISKGNLDQVLRTGPVLQMLGIDDDISASPDVFSWAVYANDTLPLGRWAITPGMRYDHNTVSGGFFSPSLGATFQLRKDLVFRGTVSRGFHYPPLSYSEGGGLFLDPNPDLEAEEVLSYQAGMETTALPWGRAKATLFQHDIDQALVAVRGAGGPPTYNDLIINDGEQQRRGFELEMETDPIKNFSLEVSGDYVKTSSEDSENSITSYICNLILSYDNPGVFTARLSGHLEDVNIETPYQAKLGEIIWDLNIIKPLVLGETVSAKFFITGHNLLDGDQYWLMDTKNPGRWFEGGMRFAF